MDKENKNVSGEPTPKKPSEKSPVRKMLIRLLIYGSAVFMLLILTGYLLLRIPHIQHRIKAFAIATLEKQFDLQLEFREVSGNLLIGLSVEDVKLKGSTGPILSAGRISVRYQLPMLLQKKLVIQQLSLDRLHLDLIRKEDGTWNISDLMRSDKQAPDKPPSGQPFEIVVNKLLVTSSTVNIEDSGGHPTKRYLFEDIQIDVGLESARMLTANIRNLAFRLNDSQLVLKGLEGRVRYESNDNHLILDGLSIKTDQSQLILNAKLQQNKAETQVTLDVDINALSLAELGNWLFVPELNRGHIIGKVYLNGTPKRLNHRLRLEMNGQTLTAEGTLTSDNYHDIGLVTNGTIRHLNPAGWPLNTTSGWPGDLNSDFHLKGEQLEKSERKARVALQLMASKLADYKIDNGIFDLEIDNNALVISEIFLRGQAGQLRILGQAKGINSPSKSVTTTVRAELRNFDTTTVLPGSQFGGMVNIDLNVNAAGKLGTSGKFDPIAWTGKADLQLFPSVLLDTEVNEGKLAAEWDGRVLQLTTLELHSEMGHASLKGQTTLQPLNYQINGEVVIAELKKIIPPLKKFIPQVTVDQVPNGHLKFNGDVIGKNKQIDVRATVNVDDLTYNDVTVASARIDGDWQIAGTELIGRTEGFITDIVYGENRFPRLDLFVQLNQKDISADFKLAKDTGEQFELSGLVDQWQQESRRIQLDTLKVTGITEPLNRVIPEIHNPDPVQMEIHPDSIDIDNLRLAAGSTVFQVQGRLSREGSQGLQLSLTGLDMNQLAALWQEDPEVQGQLTVEAKLGGSSESPKIDAQVRVKGPRGYEVSLSDLDFRLAYEDRAASIMAQGFRKGKKIFDLEGRSGLTLRLWPFEFTPEPGSLRANFSAKNLKLSEWPNPVRRQVAIDGLATVQLQATGDLLQPQLTGFLSLKEGYLALPQHNLSYESVQANLSLIPGKLVIDKFDLRGEREGTLSLTGDILLTGWMPSSLNLQLTGNQAPIAWRREISARIDPDISLSGKLSTLVLRGRLRIPEGRINLDRMAAGGPADIQVVGEQTADDQLIVITGTQDEGLLSSLSAEIDIEVPGNVWLRGQDMDIEIAGEMKMKKKPRGPFLLFGSLNTVRGNYQFQSRTFRITRGKVEFQGLKEPDPILDIRAESRIRDVEIIVRITGSARMLELSLESEPMMDKADIVSYLVFGRPTNALRTEQATNAQVAALDMAGQVAARQLKKILGNTLAVDEIRFEPGEKNSGSFVFGKYVTRNIFVTYRTGNISSNNYGEVGVEYEINRHFSIETQFGNDLTSGIDLIWKTDF
jgi:translocation and assembly module TamB